MEEELQKLTVVKLREKLLEKGLDTKGVKAVLVKRLLEALHSEAVTSEETKDVTQEDNALLGDSSPHPDESNGKQVEADVTDEKLEVDSKERSDEQPIESTLPSEETEGTLKRKGDHSEGEDDPKRSRIDDNNASLPEAADESESGDKIYLSLLGDESNGNDVDRSPAEPMLTDQQEDSLLGEDPIETSNAESGSIETKELDEQNALDSDDHHGSELQTSQATLPLVESGTAKDAQSTDTDAAILSNTPAETADTSSNRQEDAGTEPSATKGSDVTQGTSTADSNRGSNSNDSSSPTEKPAETQNSSREDSEKKKEWILQQQTTVTLDEYTSDLNCHIDNKSMIIAPFSDSHFALMYAGVKCTHGFIKGKIRFDVKVLELLEVDVDDEKHLLRVGFCRRLNHQSVRLGEDKYSWALCSNGKKASDGNFESFVELPDLKAGDVFSSLLDLDRSPAQLKFAHNGKDLGVAFELQNTIVQDAPVATTETEQAEKSSTAEEAGEQEESATTQEEQDKPANEPEETTKTFALYPAVLTKNVKVEVNFGQIEDSSDLEGTDTEYVFPSKANESDRVKDDIAPYTKRECELIMMIGLPSSGKSTWVQRQLDKYPERHYNVLGTANVLSRMTVEGQPRAKALSDGLDELVKKAMNCLSKLIETAAKQRRNVILDETNVNGSVQATKWRLFNGFKRRAIVVVTSADTLKERHAKRPAEEILLSDRALTEMKACFEIPSGSHFRGCVTFAELSRDEAEKVVDKYNDEAAKELGIEPRRRRRPPNHSDSHRSGSGGRGGHRGPPGSFNRNNYGDFRSRGPGRGNFHPGSTWGPMRGGGPNGPPSRWGRGGMPPNHYHPQVPRGGHSNVGRLGGGGGPYNRNGSDGGRDNSGGDYRAPRPSWNKAPYHGSGRDRDGDDRSGRDSRRYGGRDYRDDNRDSRDGGRDGWSRGGDRRESQSRFHSPPSRWSSSSASAGGRFGSQSNTPRSNPTYDSVQKPWTHGQHQSAQPSQQPQHKPAQHSVSQGSWTTTQNPQPPFNQTQQPQQQQQQQQWYQWQQYYTDPRARPSGQPNAEPWKASNPNQWVSAAAPRPGVPDSALASAQKPYQAPQPQANPQQQNQWAYWQQWQQRAAATQPAAGAPTVNQFDSAQQYQQHLAQWKQQCARYYEQNQQQPHQSQQK